MVGHKPLCTARYFISHLSTNTPTAIVKQCSSVFSELIAYLANLCFSHAGTFPFKFKHTSVTPLLKKPGLDPTVSANFWPISNLNKSPRFSRAIFLHDIASSPSFNHLQSAYRKNQSSETPLIHLLDSIYHAADNGLFSLSLDTIFHTIILKRLTSSFGIMSSSHNWLESYFSNRYYSVTAGSTFTFNLLSSCGVFQSMS